LSDSTSADFMFAT